MDWDRQREIDEELATIKSAVDEEWAIRSAINRKRSRVIDDIEALEAQRRELDRHCVETPEAAAVRATIDRLWQFTLLLDEAIARSHDAEAALQKRCAQVLRKSKANRRK